MISFTQGTHTEDWSPDAIGADTIKVDTAITKPGELVNSIEVKT